MKSLADSIRETLPKPNLLLLFFKKEGESNAILASSGEIDCRKLFDELKKTFSELRGGGNPKLVQFGNFTADLVQGITDSIKKQV